jgi:zinc/manganese transport system ATP-binding protein
MRLRSENAVVLRNLTLAYDGRAAVHHLSGSLARGSLTAIVGPNGAGKTSLLKGIVGLLRPADGIIECARLGHGGIAYLPQHAEIERRFPISVIDTVLLGQWRRIGWLRAASRELRDAAQRALDAVRLEGFERRQIETLSAGQFHAVDWRTSEDLLRLIESWHRERRTVAAVLHDLDQVRAHFPDTLLIAGECVAWGATQEVLTPHNLMRVRHMSGAWAAEAEDYRRLPGMTVVTPSA